MPAAAVALAAGLAFAPVTGFDAVGLDDARYVTRDATPGGPGVGDALRWFTTFPAGLYVPLTLASYSADQLIWRDGVRGHHRTNLILHALNAALAFLLLRAFFGTAAALSGALFFALHPAQSEPVAWISERKTLLYALFALAGSNLLVRGGKGRHALAAVLGCLSLLAKTTAVMLVPLVAAARRCGVLASSPGRSKAGDAVFGIFVSTAVIIGIVTLTRFPESMGALSADGLPRAACRTVQAIGHYAGSAVWPRWPEVVQPDSRVLFGSPLRIAGHTALAALLSVIAVIGYRRRSPAGFWALWFVLLLLPACALGVPLASRHLYLPLLAVPGLALYLAGPRMRAAAIVALLVLTGVSTHWTRQAILDWRDGFSYAKAALRAYRNDKRSMLLMADQYRLQGRPQRALALYRELRAQYPRESEAYLATAEVKLAQGRYEQVYYLADELEQALPGHPDASYLSAMAAYAHGNKAAAAGFLDEAVARGSANPLAYMNRVSVRLDQEDLDGARAAVEELAGRFARHPDVGLLRARVAAASGDLDGAERHLALAERSGSINTALYLLRADIRAYRGDLRGAEEALHGALRLQPGSPSAQTRLALLRRKMERTERTAR